MADEQRGESTADDYLYDVGGSPSVPPFRFRGVNVRVFPLRADLNRLRQFCDTFLNVFDDVATFRPLDGFVELVVLEYPNITSMEQPAFATYGQTEVFFLVPVSWKNLVTGQTRIAVITPYIFVDNPTSARIGRDLFGWPKEAAWYSRNAVLSGSSAPHLAIDKETLTDGQVTTSRLLEIDSLGTQDRLSFGGPNGESRVSFDLNGALKLAARPLRSVSRALALWNRGLRGALTQWRTPNDVLNINLKQSPQLDPVGTACYQALTVTPLRATRLNGFGLIGERRQLLGDPSGGCVVRVFEDPTWPIVAQLGLTFEAASLEGHEAQGRVAYQFKPVFPLWLSTDFEQQPSRIIASRGTPASGVDRARAPMVNVLGSRGLLGTAQGMTFRGVRVQLFELAADPLIQQRLIDALNAIDMDYCFALPPIDGTPSASVVVSVTTVEGMRSDRISLLDLHETLVEFYVPLTYRRRDAEPELSERALFGHAGFATTSTLSNTIHDTLGGNVMQANMSQGEQLGTAYGADNQLRVFRLSTTVVPHFQLGETARTAPVLEVYGRPRDAQRSTTNSPADRALPSVPLLRLKQLPSAEHPKKSSYQALVRTEWQGAQGRNIDLGIDHELCLHEYESLRLVERLGLRASVAGEAAGIAGRSRRYRPFAESLYVLRGEVTLHSRVLWERLSH